MPPDTDLPAAVRVLRLVGRAGPQGRALAARLDLLRIAGPAATWRIARDRWRGGSIPPQARRELYRRIWGEAAAELGAELRELGHGFLEIRRGGRAVRLFEEVVPLDDPVALELSLDKELAHAVLRDAGVIIPEHVVFHWNDPGPALALLDRVGVVAVKAASGTGAGEGTTLGVRRPADLHRAVLRAARFGDRLLAERQAPGLAHRILLLDGEVLDVVADGPPTVPGDGHSTIEALIAAENRRRREAGGELGLHLLPFDLDAELALEQAGLTLRSVPAAGEEVTIKSVSNVRRVEDSESYRGRLADELVDQARTAAEALGLRLAGVDIVTTDPSRPLAQTGGVVLEVNATPGLYRHYQVRDRARATPVAVPILRSLLGE